MLRAAREDTVYVSMGMRGLHRFKEPVAPTLGGLKDAGEVCGYHRGAGLIDGTQGHALVYGADHDGDAFGSEFVLDRVSDLCSE